MVKTKTSVLGEESGKWRILRTFVIWMGIPECLIKCVYRARRIVLITHPAAHAHVQIVYGDAAVYWSICDIKLDLEFQNNLTAHCSKK